MNDNHAELTELASDPQAFDTQLAGLYGKHDRIAAQISAVEERAHQEAGDKREWYGRHRVWGMSLADALGKVPALAGQRDQLFLGLADVQAGIKAMDEVYRRAPWSRFFPTHTSSGGHIHRSTSCHTLYASTAITWRPDLSGKSTEQAVNELGPVLCQVCFPEAKAEWKREPREVARERNAAAKAAAQAERDAKKAAKTLTTGEGGEAFRRRYNGDRVTTVAACKDLIRKAVEQRVEVDYFSTAVAFERWQGDAESFARVRQNAAGNLVKRGEDAERAARVLIAREAAHPGWGMTAEDIEAMRARKDKSARKEWGI